LAGESFKFENMRGNPGQVLAMLIATLAHHIEERRTPSAKRQ